MSFYCLESLEREARSCLVSRGLWEAKPRHTSHWNLKRAFNFFSLSHHWRLNRVWCHKRLWESRLQCNFVRWNTEHGQWVRINWVNEWTQRRSIHCNVSNVCSQKQKQWGSYQLGQWLKPKEVNTLQCMFTQTETVGFYQRGQWMDQRNVIQLHNCTLKKLTQITEQIKCNRAEQQEDWRVGIKEVFLHSKV